METQKMTEVLMLFGVVWTVRMALQESTVPGGMRAGQRRCAWYEGHTRVTLTHADPGRSRPRLHR